MESKIKQLANDRGFPNVHQFALQARLPWPVARKVWEGDIQNIWLKTLVKVATTLDCKIEDLFTVPDEIN